MLHSCTMYQSLYRQWFERSREWFELFGEWLKLSSYSNVQTVWIFKTAQRGYSNVQKVIRSVQRVVIRNVQRVIQKCPESDSNVQRVIQNCPESDSNCPESDSELSRQCDSESDSNCPVIQGVIQNCPDSDSNCPESDSENDSELSRHIWISRKWFDSIWTVQRGRKREVFDVPKIGQRQRLKAVQKVIWSSLETLSDLQRYETSVPHFYNPKDSFPPHELLVLNWELEFKLAATHLLIQLKRWGRGC